jgi:hypothetical protein
MAETWRDGRPRAGNHALSALVSRISAMFSAAEPTERQRHRSSTAESVSSPSETAHYSVEHGGWSAIGWQEGDPTPEEAMSALASMSQAGYSVAVDGLRKTAEEQLEALRDKDGQ